MNPLLDIARERLPALYPPIRADEYCDRLRALFAGQFPTVVQFPKLPGPIGPIGPSDLPHPAKLGVEMVELEGGVGSTVSWQGSQMNASAWPLPTVRLTDPVIDFTIRVQFPKVMR